MSIKAKCREGSICIRCTECVAMEFNFVASVRTFKTESTCSGRTSSVGKPLPPLPRVARTPSTSEGASELPRRGAATGLASPSAKAWSRLSPDFRKISGLGVHAPRFDG